MGFYCFLCLFVAEAWYLRDCFKVGSALLLLGHGNQGSVCNTHDIVLQVPSYNYYKGIGYSVSK